MRRRHLWVWTLTVAATWSLARPATLFGQSLAEAQAPARHAASIEFARVLVQAAMEESGTPGMSVAVGVDGEVVWAEGFGYADVENRVPVWEETKFRVGSVSKPLTAAAVGLLVEGGRLDVDAPVQQYVPAFPEKRWPISTRQVAGHVAGIRHYDQGEFLSAVRYETVSDGLAIFADDSLLFEPGERFSYSSYGWNLVSAVVEGASGESFLPYMEEHVFGPIGMAHTIADHTDSIIPHRTRFYERGDGGRVFNAPYVDNSYKWAGGGFLSTPSDLVRFGFAHFDGGFLSSETIAELWTPLTTNDGESTGYGIGWFLDVEDGVVVEAGHGGGSVGGTTGFVTRPQEKGVVAITGNLSQAPTGGLLTGLILDAFLDPASLEWEEGGLDPSGEFACVATSRSEEEIEASLMIAGPPGAFWGRLEVGDGPRARVVHTSGGPEAVRLVLVDQVGRLLILELTSVDESGIAGPWSGPGGGTLECDRVP